MSKKSLAPLLVATSLAFQPVLSKAAPLTSGIASTTSMIEVVSAPASVRRQAYESNGAIRVFPERTLLLDSVLVNAKASGLYDAYADFTDETIPSPGVVQTYFVHFDGMGTSLTLLSGSITFANPILGVIGRSLTIEETDAALGAIGTLYPTDRFNREPEYQTRCNYDYFAISPDRLTLSVRWEVTDDVDQLRIVIAVPEPGAASLALLPLAIAFFPALIRRRD